MIYANDDPAAISAMEADRTGNYGADYDYEDENSRCPCCGAYDPDYFYLDEDEVCIGCTECVYKTTRLF